MRRIAKGIKKFVLDNPAPFIVNYKFENEPTSAAEPLPTVTSVNSHYVVVPFLLQYHSETADNEVRGQAADKPILTLDTSNRYALTCAYIMQAYGGGYTGAGAAADAPLPTITQRDHNYIIAAHILTLRKNMIGSAANEPINTISCQQHHAEVLTLLKQYGDMAIQEGEELVCKTINGEKYVVADILMRMLEPRGLFNCMGFPKDYIIERDANGKPYPKSKQIARCGNAVTPPVAAALVRANLPEYCKTKEVKTYGMESV